MWEQLDPPEPEWPPRCEHCSAFVKTEIRGNSVYTDTCKRCDKKLTPDERRERDMRQALKHDESGFRIVSIWDEGEEG